MVSFLSDGGLSRRLLAGVDYRLSERLLVGLKASHGWIDDLVDTSPYECIRFLL